MSAALPKSQTARGSQATNHTAQPLANGGSEAGFDNISLDTDSKQSLGVPQQDAADALLDLSYEPQQRQAPPATTTADPFDFLDLPRGDSPTTEQFAQSYSTSGAGLPDDLLGDLTGSGIPPMPASADLLAFSLSDDTENVDELANSEDAKAAFAATVEPESSPPYEVPAPATPAVTTAAPSSGPAHVPSSCGPTASAAGDAVLQKQTPGASPSQTSPTIKQKAGPEKLNSATVTSFLDSASQLPAGSSADVRVDPEPASNRASLDVDSPAGPARPIAEGDEQEHDADAEGSENSRPPEAALSGRAAPASVVLEDTIDLIPETALEPLHMPSDRLDDDFTESSALDLSPVAQVGLAEVRPSSLSPVRITPHASTTASEPWNSSGFDQGPALAVASASVGSLLGADGAQGLEAWPATVWLGSPDSQPAIFNEAEASVTPKGVLDANVELISEASYTELAGDGRPEPEAPVADSATIVPDESPGPASTFQAAPAGNQRVTTSRAEPSATAVDAVTSSVSSMDSVVQLGKMTPSARAPQASAAARRLDMGDQATAMEEQQHGPTAAPTGSETISAERSQMASTGSASKQPGDEEPAAPLAGSSDADASTQPSSAAHGSGSDAGHGASSSPTPDAGEDDLPPVSIMLARTVLPSASTVAAGVVHGASEPQAAAMLKPVMSKAATPASPITPPAGSPIQRSRPGSAERQAEAETVASPQAGAWPVQQVVGKTMAPPSPAMPNAVQTSPPQPQGEPGEQASPQRAETEEERVTRELAVLDKQAEAEMQADSAQRANGRLQSSSSLGTPPAAPQEHSSKQEVLPMDGDLAGAEVRQVLQQPEVAGEEWIQERPFSPPPGAAPNTTFSPPSEDAEGPGMFEPDDFRGMLYYDGVDSLGRPVVVVNAEAVASTVTRRQAMDYMLQRLEPIVTQGPYVLVMVATSRDNSHKLPAGWLIAAYRSLSRPFRKNVKFVILVRPSRMLRTVLACMRPFLSRKAHKKVKKVANLSDIGAATGGEVTLQHLGPRFASSAGQFMSEGMAPYSPTMFSMPSLPSSFSPASFSSATGEVSLGQQRFPSYT